MSETTAITFFDQARAMLEKAVSIDEVKQVRDQAEALRLYAKQQKDSGEMQERCAEIKIRAERRAGELLAEQDMHNGDPRLHAATRLKDLGIEKTQSHRWQTIAHLPVSAFETQIAETKAQGKELTSAAVYDSAKKYRKETARPVEAKEAAPTKQRWIETINAPDGRQMFIVHDPASQPTMNRTNEMVDWATWTLNPVTGCWHGCSYCYAREIANDARMSKAYPQRFEPTFHPARLQAPAHTKVPDPLTRPQDQNVFVCSMADLFGAWVPEDWIMQVFSMVRRHPEWNFLFLTKFPQRLRHICDVLDGFPPNAWMGCTVDAQARVKTAERAFDGLRASLRWLSVEPLTERLTFSKLDVFGWIVLGGQSASYFNGTPAMQPKWEWVEHLHCQARNAGLKVYWKDNLTVRPKELPTPRRTTHANA